MSLSPIKWKKLAILPIDSPHWKSSAGEEYLYQADADWIVVNEKVGPYRVRHICKIIESVNIEPEAQAHDAALEYYRRDLNPGPREHDPFPEKEER